MKKLEDVASLGPTFRTLALAIMRLQEEVREIKEEIGLGDNDGEDS